jgi:ABC-2 type transport system permease protein
MMATKFIFNLRIFMQGAVLSYRALFRWLNPATYLASKVLAPLTVMIFFVYIGSYASGSQDASYYVIGNALIFTASSGIYGVTMSIGGERWTGTLPYLFGAPANRMAMFVGRSLVHVMDGMLGGFIGLGWGVLLFNLDLSRTDPMALVVTIMITTFSTAGMGLLMGCMGLITRNVMFINNLVYFLLLLFSGANLEISTLPGWMQSVSKGIPLTRGIASTRMIVNGGGMAEVWPLLRIEILIGLVFTLAGYTLFRVFETQAKKLGTLDVF